MIFPCVNTDANVMNVVGVVDQDQDQLADLSIAFCSSYFLFYPVLIYI